MSETANADEKYSAQKNALRNIDGDGFVEPEKWVEGSLGAPIPVLDGEVLTILDRAKTIDSWSEGAESGTTRVVEDVGHVELSKSFRHPENSSHIKVSSADGE